MDAYGQRAVKDGQEVGRDHDDETAAARDLLGADDVDAVGDGDSYTDDETAKRRKKDRRFLQQNAASHRPAKRILTRTMSEWQETCRQLKLPTESQQFCDFVLAVDEIVEHDIREAKNRTGCCSCCQASSKELEECRKAQEEFCSSLKEEGLDLTEEMAVDKKHRYLLIHTPFWRLCVEAERVGLKMPLKNCPAFDDSDACHCCMEAIDNCLKTDDEDDYVSAPFRVEKLKLYKDGDNADKFFRPALRSLLTYMILINVNRNDKLNEKESFLERSQRTDTIQSKGLLYMLHNGYCDDAFPMHDEAGVDDPGKKEILEMVWSRYDKDDDAAWSSSSRGRMSTSAAEDTRHELDRTWAKSCRFQPLWKIRNYFGEKIAMYFAWCGMLIMTLWLPMLFGLAVFLYGLYLSIASHINEPVNQYRDNTSFTDRAKYIVDDSISIVKESFDNDLTPYYALVVSIWGTIFLEVWKRERSTLAYEWDVSSFENSEPDRPQFVGTEEKPDPVIPGLTIIDTTVWSKLYHYTVSLSTLLFMVCLVFVAVAAVIVYRIIMTIDYCVTTSPVGCLILTSVISAVLNAAAILILGKIYDWLAVKLTNWENHRTQTQYNDMLIIKLFAFQFVNCYTSLYYIAFFRGRAFQSGVFGLGEQYVDTCGEDGDTCMTMLSFQVLVLMLAKPIPKFLKDIIMPALKRLWILKLRPCCKKRCSRKVDDEEVMQGPKPIPKDWEIERNKPDLEDFTLGEYTEKVILYGFVMLFAASLSLAPLIAFVVLVIDIRVDAKRLLWLYRRPVAFIAQDIGMWYDILQFINMVGVVTNACLIAFTSSWGNKYDITGQLVIVIVFEHIVFSVKFLIAAFIPDIPADVRLAIKRENYQIQKLFDENKSIRARGRLNTVAEEPENDDESTRRSDAETRDVGKKRR